MQVDYDALTKTWRVSIAGVGVGVGADPLMDPAVDPATIYPAAHLGISRESLERYEELEITMWRRAAVGDPVDPAIVAELRALVDGWGVAARSVLDPFVRREAAVVGWAGVPAGAPGTL